MPETDLLGRNGRDDGVDNISVKIRTIDLARSGRKVDRIVLHASGGREDADGGGIADQPPVRHLDTEL